MAQDHAKEPHGKPQHSGEALSLHALFNPNPRNEKKVPTADGPRRDLEDVAALEHGERYPIDGKTC